MLTFIRFFLCLGLCFLVFFIDAQPLVVSAKSGEIGNLGTHYVWAKSGLRLRDKPSQNGKTLAILPYGTKIDSSEGLFLNKSDSVLIIPEIMWNRPFFLKGDWKWVVIGNQKGYAFDGYLSHLPPFDTSRSSKEYRPEMKDWLDQVSSEVAVIKAPRGNTTIYQNQASIIDQSREGGGSNTYLFLRHNEVGFKDAFLLLHYFIDLAIQPSDFEGAESPGLEVLERNGYLKVLLRGWGGGIGNFFEIEVTPNFLMITMDSGC